MVCNILNSKKTKSESKSKWKLIWRVLYCISVLCLYQNQAKCEASKNPFLFWFAKSKKINQPKDSLFLMAVVLRFNSILLRKRKKITWRKHSTNPHILISNSWSTGVGKKKKKFIAQCNGIRKDWYYLRTGNSRDKCHSDPHKYSSLVFWARLHQVVRIFVWTLLKRLSTVPGPVWAVSR